MHKQQLKEIISRQSERILLGRSYCFNCFNLIVYFLYCKYTNTQLSVTSASAKCAHTHTYAYTRACVCVCVKVCRQFDTPVQSAIGAASDAVRSLDLPRFIA